jgi:hypothetical protein
MPDPDLHQPHIPGGRPRLTTRMRSGGRVTFGFPAAPRVRLVGGARSSRVQRCVWWVTTEGAGLVITAATSKPTAVITAASSVAKPTPTSKWWRRVRSAPTAGAELSGELGTSFRRCIRRNARPMGVRTSSIDRTKATTLRAVADRPFVVVGRSSNTGGAFRGTAKASRADQASSPGKFLTPGRPPGNRSRPKPILPPVAGRMRRPPRDALRCYRTQLHTVSPRS